MIKTIIFLILFNNTRNQAQGKWYANMFSPFKQKQKIKHHEIQKNKSVKICLYYHNGYSGSVLKLHDSPVYTHKMFTEPQ